MNDAFFKLLILALVGTVSILVAVLWRAHSKGVVIDKELAKSALSVAGKLVNAIIVFSVLLIFPEYLCGRTMLTGIILGFSLWIVIESWFDCHELIKKRIKAPKSK